MQVFEDKNYAKQMNEGKIQFPGVEVGEDLDRFCLQMAKYIYGAYCSNRTTFLCGGQNIRGRTFSELRAYARGEQSPEKYLNWLDPKDKEGKRHMNISNAIVQIMPKFRDRIKGKFEEVQFDFSVNAVDPTARKEREIKKARRKLSLRPEMKSLIQMAGVKPTEEQDTTGLESDRDVDLLYALGGERLYYESLMQAAIASTQYESKWDLDLKDRLIDDLIDLYSFAFWTYVEKSTGKVKVRYVDPERTIIQKTEHNDSAGANYGGVIEEYSITRLRQETDMKEEDLIKIARRFQKFPANKSWANTTISSYRDLGSKENQHAHWNQMTVQVMNFCFVAYKAERHVYGYHQKHGNLIFDPVSKDSKLTTRDEKRGKAFLDNGMQYTYTGKWIVGTDYVFDCEPEYAMVRKGQPGFKSSMLPLEVYAADMPSIIERCIGYLDDIQLATLKKRNSLAKMPPGPRMIIDISKLHDTITIGGTKYSTLDMVRAFPKEGILIVKSKGEFDYLGQGASNGRPIDFMPTGLVEDLQIFLSEIQDGINSIKAVTGIDDAIDMSQGRDILVGVMKGAEAQTNTSLRPLYKAYKIMSFRSYEYTMLKWQVLLASREVDVTYMPIGAPSAQSVKLIKELTAYEFGLQVEALPGQEEKMLLMQYLYSKRDSGQIAIHHVFAIEQMIRAGRLQVARLYIARAEQERIAQAQAQEIEKIRANGEANSQPIAAQAQADKEKLMLEYDLKARLAKVESDLKAMSDGRQFEQQQLMAGAQMGANAATQAA